jgi:hypothetical protein
LQIDCFVFWLIFIKSLSSKIKDKLQSIHTVPNCVVVSADGRIMPFQAHEHLCRTMPALTASAKRDHYGNRIRESHEPCRHESFITFVPSAASSPAYKCELCDVIMNADAEIHAHCQTKDHIDRVKEVQALQAQPTVVWSTAMQVRVDQLGSQTWQSAMYRQLYWCLIYQSLRDRPVNVERMTQAELLLAKFEFMEQASLLELAAWKAVCIALPAAASSLQASAATTPNYHAWQEWMREGWKERKSTTRHANEIVIIVSSVLPFLPKHYLVGSGSVAQT